MQKSYDTESIIKVTPKIVLEGDPDDPDGTDGCRENASPSKEVFNDDMTVIADNNNPENYINITTNKERDVKVTQSEVSESIQTPQTLSQEPSEPSEPSGMLKCYWCDKVGSKFQTNIKEEYEKHGILKHLNKSLYPKLVTIKENGRLKIFQVTFFVTMKYSIIPSHKFNCDYS